MPQVSRNVLLFALAWITSAPQALARSTTVHAPGWLVDHWDQSDGLPTRVINDITVDGEGVVWLATFDGLVRFDGVHFDSLRSSMPGGPPSNRIQFVTTHPTDGALWLRTETGTIQRRAADTHRAWPDPQHRLRYGFAHGSRDLWGVTDGGLVRMSTELEPIDAPMPQLGFLATGPDDRLWLIDYPSTLWTRTTAPDSAWRAVPHRLPDLNRLVGRDPHTGRLAIQHEGQTQVWDPDTASFVPSPDGQYVTQNTPPAPALQQSPAQGAAPHAPDLSGPPFTDGPQWSLDPVAGIRRVRRAAVQTVLPPSDNADNADTPVNVSRLWWDDTTETLWALAAKTRWWPVWSQHPDPRLPEVNPSCPIWTTRYFRDPSEALWLACANLVHRWEGDAWVSDAPPDRGQAGPAWNTRQGLFLGGERSTLAQLTEAGWTTIQDADGKGIPDIYALVELDDGRLIAGGLRGVWLSSPGAPAEVLPELQAIGTVRHLRQDGAWVWISTVDRGLCVLPAATPTAPVRCLDEDSLQDRGTVHTTIEDHRGRTFISTNQGIGVVSSARLQAWAEGSDAPVPYWLGTDHGMATAECNGFVGDAAARTPDGKLWFASQDGVVVVDPRALELPAAPAIQFIDAQTGDTSVLRPTTLHLAADHPPVHLRWSTAAVEDAERVSFRYRVGEAAAWSRLGPGRTLDLPTVPPGDSRLHVQARLGDDWGPVAELSLHRVPHLTERGLFPLLISLLASIVVGLSIAARALMLRRVNRNLERRVQDQTRAIASRNTTLEQLNETLGEQNQTLAEQSTMLQGCRSVSDGWSACSRRVDTTRRVTSVSA